MLTFTHVHRYRLFTLRFVHVSLSLTHFYKTHLQSSSQSLLRVSPSIHNTQKCLTCRATFKVPVLLGVLWELSLCLCWLVDKHLVLFEMYIVQGFKARTLELTQNPGFTEYLRTQDQNQNQTQWRPHQSMPTVRHGWRGRCYPTVLVTNILCQLGWG